MLEIPDSVGKIISIVLYILGAYLLAFYVGLVVWTARDISARSRDWLVRSLAVLLVLVFNIPGMILYLVLRPRETLAEVYGRALEEEALLRDIEEQAACPNCRRRVSQEWVVCPHCRMALKNRCSQCDHLLNPSWEVCAYCGAEQPKAEARPARVKKTTPAAPAPQGPKAHSDEATNPVP
ncbi:MAG: zinc ribbon domain-containing protein [Anaerolineae bacterium]